MRDGWPHRRLVDVVTLPTGQVSPLAEPYRSQVLLAPDHIEPRTGRILARETAELQGAVSGKYRVARGDVVLSKIRPYLRKAALVDFEGTCSADMYPLRPSSEINPRYLLAIVLGEDFSRFAESVSARTGIPKLNREELSEYSVTLPPIGEQRAFAEVLSAVDEQIAAEIKLSGKSTEVANTAIRELIGPALALMQTTEASMSERLLGHEADSWHFRKLDYALRSIESGSSPSLEDRPAGEDQWGVLKVSAVKRSGFIEDENKVVDDDFLIDTSIEVHSGDFLISRANTPELVGQSCIVTATRPQLMLCDKTLRLRINESKALPVFVNEMLAQPEVRRQIETAATGTSGSMKNISQPSIRNLVLPWADFATQEAVSNICAMRQAAFTTSVQRLAKLRATKAALMNALLPGRASIPVSS